MLEPCITPGYKTVLWLAIIMVIFYFCCHMTDASPAGLLSVQTQPPLPQCQHGDMRHTEEQNIVGNKSAVSWILLYPRSAQHYVNERNPDIAFMHENTSSAVSEEALTSPALKYFFSIYKNSE